MAELFGTGRQAVTKHLQNIYETNELRKDSTCSILELVRQEGKRIVKRKIEFYNLDVIISVGFRINTKRGIEFRQWATTIGHRQPQCPVPSCQSGAIQQSPRSFPADRR